MYFYFTFYFLVPLSTCTALKESALKFLAGMAGQPQKLEIDDGEGYRNIGGSLQRGGAANRNKKILSLVAAALVLMGTLATVLYFALGTTDTTQAQLKITHKVTLTIGDQRGNKLGEIVIGVLGEHVPVAAYNFVALADHTLDKAPGSHVVGFGYRGSSFSRVRTEKFFFTIFWTESGTRDTYQLVT